jgi:hypothetical protein
MRDIIIAIFVVLLLASVSLAQDNMCLECHQSFEDEEDGPSWKIERDIHHQKGLSCVACHGGDPTLDDMDDVREVADYRGIPDYTEVPQFCARCHSDAVYMRNHNPNLSTDQLAQYKTSTHGRLLLNQGNTDVANCVSCHGVHDINNARLPHSSTHPLNLPHTCAECHSDADHMAGYDIPTDQFELYSESVHGRALLVREDLGAPACNDCHSNHGASPPGVKSLTYVCGNCHAVQESLFEASPHWVAFNEMDFPMCQTCHSNHLVEPTHDGLVGAEEPSYCIDCHYEGDDTEGIPTAVGMHRALVNLAEEYDSSRAVVSEAETKGMMVTDETFLLKEVGQVLIQARTHVHAFVLDSVTSKTEVGMAKADTVQANAAALIDEYYFRRKGLGLATLFITVLVVTLWLRIRKTERG